MSIWSFFNWKICLGIMVLALIIPLIFVPPSTWNEVFWRYFHETPIIEWIGQLGWIFFFAALATIGIVSIKEVFS